MIKLFLSGLALFMLTSATNVMAQNTNVDKLIGNITAVKNSEVRIPVVLHNINTADVKDITLTLDIAGKKQQTTVSPDMISKVDGSVMFYVTAETPATTGLSDIEITVDAINGVKSHMSECTAKGSIMTVSRKVPHKVLIEDYTAIWCQTCPTGIVGLERTKINYGDKVAIITAHSQDPMTCKDYNEMTKIHLTTPRATVDRDPGIGDVNPYLGSERGDNGAGYGLGFDIEEQMAIDPVVDIKIDGGIDGKIITIKSDITALYTGDANLAVSFAITQDSLSNPNWKQQNSMPLYYRDHEIIQKEPLFEEWFNGELTVPGVKYNDVVRAASEPLKGNSGIIPAQVKEEETYSCEHVFDMDDYVKVKNTDYMNLFVFVIDNNTGKIVNTASVKLSDCNDIDGVEAGSDNIVEVARYTIDGQRIAVPEKGINIIRYSDGSAKKIIVK